MIIDLLEFNQVLYDIASNFSHRFFYVPSGTEVSLEEESRLPFELPF